MTTYAAATSSPTAPGPELIRTARLTGAFYLGLAITGMLGFLWVRGQLFATGSPEASDAAATVQLLYTATEDLWGVGAMFFGLWLIPMGWLVLRSGWMPRALGWILIGGGVGYLLSSFTTYLFPDTAVLTDLLAFPATIGEFWIIGYLLVLGVRSGRSDEEAPKPG